MEVVLRLPDGGETVVEVEGDWTVEKLRECVEETTGLKGVTLTLGEDEMRGEDLLCDTGMTGDSVVLVTRGLSSHEVSECIEYLGRQRRSGKKRLLSKIDSDLALPASDDAQVVMYALGLLPSGEELLWVGRSLWQDRGFVWQLVCDWNGGWKPLASALDKNANWVWDDEEVVLKLVSRKGSLLERARARVISRRVVLAAAQQEGYALLCAPHVYHCDGEIVLAALEKAPGVVDSLPCELWRDREAVLRLVAFDGSLLHRATEELQADREVVAAAVASNPAAIMDAHPDLLQDREIIKTCLSSAPGGIRNSLNYSPLRYVGFRNQDDKEMVLFAVSHCAGALRDASPRLRGDPEVVMAAVTKNPFSFKYAAKPAIHDRVIRQYVQAKVGSRSAELGL
eukprot:Sspe_Gene.29960::Locus_14523_Transcript_1_1_Confidence_1.000_Length_1378::g.29960::m.29960